MEEVHLLGWAWRLYSLTSILLEEVIARLPALASSYRCGCGLPLLKQSLLQVALGLRWPALT